MKRLLLFKTKVLYILGGLLIIWGFQLTFSHLKGFREFYLYHFYPWLSETLRRVTGWFPFSIGDLIYVLATAWLLIGLFQFFKNLFLLKKRPFGWLNIVLRFVFIVLVVYFLFLLFWGFNYRDNRLYADLGISGKTYSAASLQNLCDTLVVRLNRLHYELAGNDTLPVNQTLSYKEIRNEAISDYRILGRKYPLLNYVYPSIKPSMFGYLMNFAGITGYYNPFTGEAQVNTTPPPIALPFTTCHEMAHQIGFAAEDDANFLGYFVASNSPNTFFRYSANFSLLLYAINALAVKKPRIADSLWDNHLTEGVRKDYEAHFAFYQKFHSGVRPLLDQAYDQYLKANDQKKGIRSYRGVVALVLNYEKVFGKLP